MACGATGFGCAPAGAPAATLAEAGGFVMRIKFSPFTQRRRHARRQTLKHLGGYRQNQHRCQKECERESNRGSAAGSSDRSECRATNLRNLTPHPEDWRHMASGRSSDSPSSSSGAFPYERVVQWHRCRIRQAYSSGGLCRNSAAAGSPASRFTRRCRQAPETGRYFTPRRGY